MPWAPHTTSLRPLFIGIALTVAVGIVPSIRAQMPSNGPIMLIEFEKIDGIRHWERELGQRARGSSGNEFAAVVDNQVHARQQTRRLSSSPFAWT